MELTAKRRDRTVDLALKRLMDIVGALFGLLILLPVLLVTAILIKRDSPGPVFYRGTRVGLNGQPFRMYKFRTMVVNADQIGGSSTPHDDPRITQVGCVLREYKLDELPQLINVLKGDMSQKERKALVEEILTDVGLKDFMHRKPSQMSGGQQQRVAIARALVKKPQLILADEPTANLDSKTGKEVLELMLQLNEKTGATFIFSTHDRMVMDFGRRLILLKDGQIKSDEKRG